MKFHSIVSQICTALAGILTPFRSASLRHRLHAVLFEAFEPRILLFGYTYEWTGLFGNGDVLRSANWQQVGGAAAPANVGNPGDTFTLLFNNPANAAPLNSYVLSAKAALGASITSIYVSGMTINLDLQGWWLPPSDTLDVEGTAVNPGVLNITNGNPMRNPQPVVEAPNIKVADDDDSVATLDIKGTLAGQNVRLSATTLLAVARGARATGHLILETFAEGAAANLAGTATAEFGSAANTIGTVEVKTGSSLTTEGVVVAGGGATDVSVDVTSSWENRANTVAVGGGGSIHRVGKFEGVGPITNPNTDIFAGGVVQAGTDENPYDVLAIEAYGSGGQGNLDLSSSALYSFIGYDSESYIGPASMLAVTGNVDFGSGTAFDGEFHVFRDSDLTHDHLQWGDQWTLMTAGSFSGGFDGIDLSPSHPTLLPGSRLGLGSGLWTLSEQYDSIHSDYDLVLTYVSQIYGAFQSPSSPYYINAISTINLNYTIDGDDAHAPGVPLSGTITDIPLIDEVSGTAYFSKTVDGVTYNVETGSYGPGKAWYGVGIAIPTTAYAWGLGDMTPVLTHSGTVTSDTVTGGTAYASDFATASADWSVELVNSDPMVVVDGVLVIEGSAAADTIDVAGSGSAMTVTYDGQTYTPSGTINTILIDGDSSDTVTIHSLPSSVSQVAFEGGVLNLDAAAGTAQTLAGAVFGMTEIDKTGAGTWTLSGGVATDSAVTIDGGVLVLGGDSEAGAVSGAGTLVVNTGTTLSVGGDVSVATLQDDGAVAFNGSGTVTISTAISGAGGVTQSGDGALILTGTNTYSGATTIAGGVLQVGDGGSTGTLGGGDVSNEGVLVFDRSGAVTVANTISGEGDVSKGGGGTVMAEGVAGRIGWAIGRSRQAA